MEILSLGAGVQSTALLLLSASGKLPKLDYAIFADTGWETESIYKHLKNLDENVAKPAGIKMIYAKASGNIREDMLDTERSPNGAIPVYVTNSKGKTSLGSRQCTRHYKVRPIEREIRKLLGAGETPSGRVGPVRKSQPVNLWVGISTDEVHRAKDSPKKYITHKFPLIFDLNWTRQDCKNYLESEGFTEVAKSSCVCCAFRGDNGFLEIKTNHPDEWKKLVDFDKSLRSEPTLKFVENYKKTGAVPFMHRSAIPLDEIELKPDSTQSSFSCSPWTCEWEKP